MLWQYYREYVMRVCEKFLCRYLRGGQAAYRILQHPGWSCTNQSLLGWSCGMTTIKLVIFLFFFPSRVILSKHSEASNWHDEAGLQSFALAFACFSSVLSLPRLLRAVLANESLQLFGENGSGLGCLALWPSCFMNCVYRGFLQFCFAPFGWLFEGNTFKITEFTFEYHYCPQPLLPRTSN